MSAKTFEREELDLDLVIGDLELDLPEAGGEIVRGYTRPGSCAGSYCV